MSAKSHSAQDAARSVRFVSNSGEVFEQLSGPGAAIPLSDAIHGIAKSLRAAGEKDLEITLNTSLMNDGSPDGPLRMFATGEESPIKITIRGKITE